jgi:hypothetical protein
VPKVVREEVPYTAYERRWKEVPYECTVTVCRPETRERQVKVCRMVPETRTKEVTRYECVPEKRTREVEHTRYVRETRTREVEYTECVPEQREEQVEVTEYKRVAETKTKEYEVCVPYTEMVEKEVRVCRMVKEERPVATCGTGCGTSGCYAASSCGATYDDRGHCRPKGNRRGLLARLGSRRR